MLEGAATMASTATGESGVGGAIDGEVEVDGASDAAAAVDAFDGMVGRSDAPAEAGALDVAADAPDLVPTPVDATTDAMVVDTSDGGSLAVGLVALYPFDETGGTTSADTSGHAYNATMNGATFSPGVRGNAATLNGNGQYVSLPGGILNGLKSFSICSWAKFNSAVVRSRLFDFGSDANTYLMFDPFNATTPRFAITVGGRTGEQILDGPALPTRAWEHVAITATAGTYTMYLNGANVAQGPIALSPGDLGVTTQNWLGKGHYPNNPFQDGQFDQFRIYSRALNDAEVQQLFQQRQ